MVRIMQPVLIDGVWREARSVGTFQAVDPSTGSPLPGLFPISSFEDVEAALAASRRACKELARASPERIAAFLERFAEGILGRADELVETAHRETALPKAPRLGTIELPRTIDQLRQAAEASRDRSWRRAAIDTKSNIRSIHGPLGGPVIVFGPNNFPFAFNSAAGGDMAAAIAAGNPVLAKAHPYHPATTKLFAEIARSSLEGPRLPPATLQMIYHLRPEDGLRLVAHPLTGATAFTGGRPSGMRLKEAADRAGKPISLEMSSVNPVFILPGALRERGEAIAAEFSASCSGGAGQFCTKPGLVVVLDGADGRDFLAASKRNFNAPPSGFLLGRSVLESLQASMSEMAREGAEVLTGGKPVDGPGFQFENTLLKISGRAFLSHPGRFQHEAFGTVSLVVLVGTEDEMLRVAEALEGNLSACVYSDKAGADDGLYSRLAPVLRTKAGRLLNDKMPTGLAVVPSMVHGGPFPATGHPGFTSVGFPASLLRFTALQCYDNVRPDRLPPDLQDENPTGKMWRLIDGEWTRK
jgi:NADP-dependent aldehyde dehydrogenase